MKLTTVSDIQTQFLIRNNRTTTDGFITDATLNTWTEMAINYASTFKKWPYSEGRVSTTFASLATNEDGWLEGVYPEGWKPDSIRRLTIGGKKVQKTEFYKFGEFFEQNPSSNERIYTDFGRVYYVNPSIDLSGTITAWGQYTPTTDASDKTATTIFSYNDEDGNEAVLLKMKSYLKDREHLPDEVVLADKQCDELLNKMWTKITAEQFNYRETDDEGMFKRVDVLGGALREDLFKRDQFL